MEVIKTCGEDFRSYGKALTLSPDYVDPDCTVYRENSSGWFIKGAIYKDYCCWVNDFEAFHPKKKV
jgi:hypothetical protein